MANRIDRTKDKNNHAAGLDAETPASSGGFYEIYVKGQLNSCWSEWLEGLEVKLLENGEMVLKGPLCDQAALMGVLNKLSRLNLILLSINQPERKISNG